MSVIQVMDAQAARKLTQAGALTCPKCSAPVRRWGSARKRAVRDLDGGLVTVRPDRVRCRGCRATHVVLPANLLAGRAYGSALIGRALLRHADGVGHRAIADELAVPPDTVRGWLRRAAANAAPLRALGIRTLVAYDQDLLPSAVQRCALADTLDALGAAASAVGRRFGVGSGRGWPLVVVITGGRLLAATPPT